MGAPRQGVLAKERFSNSPAPGQGASGQAMFAERRMNSRPSRSPPQEGRAPEGYLAAWMIGMKASASSDAPPTKAPSISACESSSLALLALTLPP